mmetsp:Transcript_14843/g.21244  ORF Transcript_14843/g.21244 Transcript_14843/m.21244 type:complete len:122 (+) Transcript_14843:3904-4269(+)
MNLLCWTRREKKIHSITAKCLYFCKRIRPDVDPTLAFLTTRVSKCTEQDWKKLLKLLGFLKGTIDDIRLIGVLSLQDLYTWIDAAYGVHNDIRRQTGSAWKIKQTKTKYKELNGSRVSRSK